MTVEIVSILGSSHFDQRRFAEFRNGFSRPITAEDVLDHVIDDLLYAEQR